MEYIIVKLQCNQNRQKYFAKTKLAVDAWVEIVDNTVFDGQVFTSPKFSGIPYYENSRGAYGTKETVLVKMEDVYKWNTEKNKSATTKVMESYAKYMEDEYEYFAGSVCWVNNALQDLAAGMLGSGITLSTFCMSMEDFSMAFFWSLICSKTDFWAAFCFMEFAIFIAFFIFAFFSAFICFVA